MNLFFVGYLVGCVVGVCVFALTMWLDERKNDHDA